LLVDFSDEVATIPTATVSNYANQVGYTGDGNNGSVRDYFYDVSDGALTYTNYVPTVYYRANYTKAYYTDTGVSYGTRARELIIEAMTAMNNSGFDFSQYDADSNGIIDAVNCFYAGGRWNSWGQGLWPHSWTVDYCADGVCTYKYQITDMGSALTISTFCHENGHMLMGWPDLYDYDGDSAGVGRFCLMCSSGSSTNPIEPCAYMKADAGWANLTVLSATQAGIPVSSASNVVYKMPRPGHSNEYYMVENRQQTGRDTYVRDNGLAIWHVDTNGDNSDQQQTPSLHYLVTLVQADGNWDLENDVNIGDATDLYAAPTYTDCTPSTYPNTDWWDGTESGHAVTNISASSSLMTFDFGDAPPSTPTGLVAVPGELSVSLDWDPSPASDFDYFIVERDTTPGFGPGTVSDTTADSDYVDGPIPGGVAHFYRVSAVDVGSNQSVPSSYVAAIPLPDMPPTIPIEFAALGGGSVVELRWTAGPEVDIAGYHIIRDTTFMFVTPDTLGFPGASPYIDSTVPIGTAYWYTLVAEDVGGLLSPPAAPVAGIAVTGDAYYVDVSNTGPDNGSFGQPYNTIAEAMGDATPDDVVILFEGHYYEGVQLELGVSFIGMRGPYVTIITGGVSAIGLGTDVVLKGVGIDGEGSIPTGLNCLGSRLTVEDCSFRNMTTEGVKCQTGGAAHFRRNEFTSNQTAVSCSDSTRPFLGSNIFDNNTFAHVLSFGDPGPTLGGSLAAANDFTTHGNYAVWHTGGTPLAAEYNYWGADCADPVWFNGLVDYEPWTDAAHASTFTDCWADVPEWELPRVAYVLPGYPNPLNPGTSISYGLPEPGGRVTLRVYDVSGRLVRTLENGHRPAGRYTAHWDGTDSTGAPVASGVYFYRLEAPGFESQGKSIVLR
ncbi:MAG: M6 family metalloprotease domain-containing protein, partial [Candidatus Eisenbacteria bacterium]